MLYEEIFMGVHTSMRIDSLPKYNDISVFGVQALPYCLLITLSLGDSESLNNKNID